MWIKVYNLGGGQGMADNKPLEEFYAVTASSRSTSVYHIVAKGNDIPEVTKIEVKGYSTVHVGHKLQTGTMLAITQQLQMFLPEGGGVLGLTTSFERNIEHVNTFWWGGHSSAIVALFKNKGDALECFEHKRLTIADHRWLRQTTEVIEEIGDNHPTVVVCRYPTLSLLDHVPSTSTHVH
jgi:hypothetical protein